VFALPDSSLASTKFPTQVDTSVGSSGESLNVRIELGSEKIGDELLELDIAEHGQVTHRDRFPDSPTDDNTTQPPSWLTGGGKCHERAWLG
jgi:hypothetical protein